MKKIVFTFIISGLMGCQNLPQKPELIELPRLTADELCQLLGTFNDDGEFVLKVHDELNKRTEKINTEKCFSLEIAAKKENELNKSSNKNRSMMNHEFLYPLPIGLSKHELNALRKKHKSRKKYELRKMHE